MKLNDVKVFKNHINNIKEMITYFKKNHKSRKKNKNYKTLNTILESVDTIVIIGATSTSITLSVTVVGLNILPKLAVIACTLSLGIKVLQKFKLNKHRKYKKQCQIEKQMIKTFDKLSRKSLRNSKIDKNEEESLCIIFDKNLNETKTESFL